MCRKINRLKLIADWVVELQKVFESVGQNKSNFDVMRTGSGLSGSSDWKIEMFLDR